MSYPTAQLTAANINERLIPEALASLKAGYRVFYVPSDTPRPTGFMYVCEHIDGPFVTVSIPTNRFEPLSVTAPVPASREWGRGVHVGDEDTPTMEAIEAGVNMPDVKIRFLDTHPNTVVPNIGKEVMSFWADRNKITELI